MKRIVLLATLFVAVLPSVVSAKRPNVVILLIDDLGYTDLGCYGSEFYRTPRIDALAGESFRFTDFYSANPVCSPTRAALMTGKSPQRVGITQWIAPGTGVILPHEEETIGEAFADAGYATGYIGKWHLGEAAEYRPDRQGFAWTKCVSGGGAPPTYFYPYKEQRGGRTKAKDVPDLEDGKEGDYLTDKLTDYALEFIGDNRDRPFFFCFGHYAVHTPIQAPEPLVKLNQKRRAEKYGESQTPVIPEGTLGSSRGRQDNPTYSAMMDNLDVNVGRVVDRLTELGLRENTIIVFTSDNGGLSTLRKKRVGPTSVLPLRAGKGWTYEGGIRIPTFGNIG
ncbi:MAG: sulfatase-like hydrolase/transferase [Planctomycetota bacterium]